MTYIDLTSVGSTLTSELIVFPIDCSEAPETASDAEEMMGTHLYDVDNEWFMGLSSTDLTALFNFIEETQDDLEMVTYNSWRDNIQSEWYQVNVIDCTEGSNWTESYGVEEDGYLLSDDDDVPENPTQEDFEEVVPTEEELNSPAMDALVEHLMSGGTLPNFS